MNLNIWLSDLQCSGEETRLLDCPRELNYDLYTFAMLNAGVECTNDTNYTSGKSSSNFKNVVVFHSEKLQRLFFSVSIFVVCENRAR